MITNCHKLQQIRYQKTGSFLFLKKGIKVVNFAGVLLSARLSTWGSKIIWLQVMIIYIDCDYCMRNMLLHAYFHLNKTYSLYLYNRVVQFFCFKGHI